MTERVKATGPSLNAALRSAVAELAQTDESKVEVRIEAPGFDAQAANEVEVRVAVASADTATTTPDDRAEPGDPQHDEGDDVNASDDEAGDRQTNDEDRDRGDSAARGDRGDRGESNEITVEDLDAEADAAADLIESLLDAMELPGDLQIRVHEDHAEIEIVNVGSGALIGRRGSTLEALQELVRSALQREFQRRARVQIDIEGYRARRLERLLEKAEEAIDEVLDTGEAVRLEPMDVFERKKIHHLVAEVDGVSSRSQGREPGRRVIIEPDED